MTFRSRIILIVIGVILFFLVAPLIIFLARGYFFDFKAFRLIGTGILTIKTDPKGADIFVDGKKNKTAPATFRLLLPGEYEILLKKPGYRGWSKKVTIYEHLVTSIPQDATREVDLIISSLVQTTISTTTSDFVKTGSGIFFSEKAGIFQLEIAASQKTLVATTTLSQVLKSGAKNSGGLFRLSESALWQNDQKLISKLPFFEKGEIITSPDNQVYLLLDSDLYQVREELNKVNSNISYAYWEENADVLIYGNEHEIWFFDPFGSGKSALITRSTKTLGHPVYHAETNYVFVSEDREIKAIEVDPLGQPNIYTLTETTNDNIKIAINPEGTHLLYLDGQNLYTLKIR